MRSEMRAWGINSHTLIRAIRALEVQRQATDPMGNIHRKIGRSKHQRVRRMGEFPLDKDSNMLEQKHFDSSESLKSRHGTALDPEFCNVKPLCSSTDSDIGKPSSVGKVWFNTHR
jgi:hypothetical protein